jgi:predicted nucleic-acid-binding Zn-ribbon protein
MSRGPNKCPKCGSRNYTRSKTVDLEITHIGNRIVRRIDNSAGMPWWFKCNRCGLYEEV